MSSNLEFFGEAATVRDEFDEVPGSIGLTYREVVSDPMLDAQQVGTPMDYALGTDDGAD